MGNKRALIIGSSSGIGLAVLQKLSLEGYDSTAIHRDRRQQVASFQEEIERIQKEHNVTIDSHNVDATSEEKIKELIPALQESNSQPYHLVLHSVSRGNLKPLIEKDGIALNSYDLQLTIQAMGTNVHFWVQQLLAANLIAKGSRIVTLTSEGNDRCWPGYGAVGLAKSTLETLSKYLAVELAETGITVNIVQAGVTDTPSLRMIPEVERLLEHSKMRNPSGRITKAEDVANAIYLLTLPEAAWITGSLIHVDGAEHLI